jgi:hypothetical protein
MKERSEGAGRRGGEPTPSQAGRPEQTQTPQQRGEGIRGVPPPQGEPAKPQQETAESQSEPADLNVSSADTVEAESPEAGLNDNAPRKLRRWRSSSVGGGRLHGYGEDEVRKQNPPPPSDDQQQ